MTKIQISPEEAADIAAAEAIAKAAKEAPKSSAKNEKSNVIKHKGKSYVFAVQRFILPGIGTFEAQDAANDEEIIAAIVAIEGQGVLREIIKP